MKITGLNPTILVVVVVSWVMFAFGPDTDEYGFVAGVASACIALCYISIWNTHAQKSPTDESKA